MEEFLERLLGGGVGVDRIEDGELQEDFARGMALLATRLSRFELVPPGLSSELAGVHPEVESWGLYCLPPG